MYSLTATGVLRPIQIFEIVKNLIMILLVDISLLGGKVISICIYVIIVTQRSAIKNKQKHLTMLSGGQTVESGQFQNIL